MKKILLSILTAGCVLSVQAAVFNYSVTLDGPSEFPANGSPGTGFGTVDYDDSAHTLTLQVSFTGLSGTVTASHIHAATTAPFFQNAGVATTTPTFAGFPLGVTSGTYNNILDLTLASSWNPSYVTAQGGIGNAETALATAMAEGKAYWNIHTSTFGGGEIRGFLTPVPEPSTFALLGLGICSVAIGAWNKRRADRG